MQITTSWLTPTFAFQDDTIGSNAWSGVANLYADDSAGLGDNSATGYFVTGGDTFSLQYAHLVFNNLPVYANNEVSSPDTYPFANQGGLSDLWGESSIAGSQVNNSKFGVAIGIGTYNGVTHSINRYYLVVTGFDTSSIPDDAVIDGIEVDIDEYTYSAGGGTTGIGIDTIKVRIRYTWDITVRGEASSYGGIFIDPPNRQLPYKKYRYKVRSESGDYLGDWRDVESNPSYKQDINNVIGSMPVSFARNDFSVEQEVASLLNEDDTPLTDENDSPFLIDISPKAGLGEGSTLDTNHQVEVDAIYGQFEPLLNEDDTPILNEDGSMILVEEGYPLGRTIFRGYVPRWELPLSGARITGEIRSYSQDLANILLETEDVAYVDNSTLDASGGSIGIAGAGAGDYTDLAQTVTLAAQKRVSKIRVYPLAGWTTDVDLTLNIYADTPGVSSTSLGVGTVYVNANDPVPYIDIPLESPALLAAGTYTLAFSTSMTKTGGNPTYPVSLKKSTSYGGGGGYYKIKGGSWTSDTWDLAFILYEAGGDTTVPFLSKDPSQMLRSVVDFARSRGAKINYTSDSIQVTGTLVSYTFNTNNVKEAIEKILELCPDGWYFYYDFGTDTIYLREASTTPDRWLRKGQTVVDGKIVKTIEQVVNDVVFSGGGDPALYVRRRQAPVAGTRRGLKKLSDNRVEVQATGELLADSEIDQFDDPLYAGDVTIKEDGSFYLEDVPVGEMVGFIGFGTLVDGIVVQSVSKDYRPDTMPLTLTYNVPKINKRIEDIKRNLSVIENQNNPTEPT